MKKLLFLLSFLALAAYSQAEQAGNMQLDSNGNMQVDNTTALSDGNRVIYELNLYDFTPQGTLAAAQQKLAELRRLGIDIIWLMPIYPRGIEGKIGTLGSPYAPRDFTAVNADHGTLTDLQNFVKAAHALDMKVWLDWVPNHTGLDHVWVSSHPEYYKQQNGNIIHPNDYGDVYQLNYQNENLRKAMTDAMLYWVNNADIDGFRCDYISSPEIPVSYWQTAIPTLQNNSLNKRVEMLGEADFIAQPELYQTGFDFDYQWSFNTALKSVGTGTDIATLKTEAQKMLNTINGDNYKQMDAMVYLTNHDDIGDNFCCNYLTQLGSNVAPMTVVSFTLYGMPLLYNGQEIGQTTVLNFFNRSSINWNKSNTTLQNLIRALVALKHTQPALANGTRATRANTRMLETNNSSVLAFEKQMEDNTVVVVVGVNDKSTTVTVSGIDEGEYIKVLDSQNITNGFSTSTVNLTAASAINLPAKGYQIYIKKQLTGSITIKAKNSTDWGSLYLWAWTGSDKTNNIKNFFTAWPGHEMTLKDDSYTYTFSRSYDSVNIIFASPDGKKQTANIEGVTESTCYEVFADGRYNIINCLPDDKPTAIFGVEADTHTTIYVLPQYHLQITTTNNGKQSEIYKTFLP